MIPWWAFILIGVIIFLPRGLDLLPFCLGRDA